MGSTLVEISGTGFLGVKMVQVEVTSYFGCVLTNGYGGKGRMGWW